MLYKLRIRCFEKRFKIGLQPRNCCTMISFILVQEVKDWPIKGTAVRSELKACTSLLSFASIFG